MKQRLVLMMATLGLGAVWAAAPGNPALVQNQVVYLLPMSNSFDQYLATELIKNHVLTVTTDPKKATVVLTDRLGEPLELKLKEYYEPEPVKKEKDKDKDKDGTESASAVRTNSLPPRINSFGGGKGMVYLVDARSRQVLWSTYARPKYTTPDELNRAAEKVTHRLMKDATPSVPHQ